MTHAPSIKEALEQILDMPCSMVNDSDSLRHTIKTMQSIAKVALATLQPSGERREAIARIICYWDETGTCHDNYCAGSCRAKKPNAEFFKAADEILASGLVQDEAGIRADEREKCAEIADLRYEPVATEIAAAIRSARNGGAET